MHTVPVATREVASPQPYTPVVAKPTILTVDDDPPVLRAIERDLRRQYNADYRVLGAESGTEALELTRELTLRGEAIALFVVDQRMPVMTGIEFLRAAILLQTDARKVLLTAYADTDVVITAINEIRLDHYILKPWDPPEERLYPVLDDLLTEWGETFRPTFVGLRLLCGRWAPRGHAIRDYLTRNQVPYTWIDPEADDEGRALMASLTRDAEASVSTVFVLLPGGVVLRDPTNREIAEAVGLATQAALPFYDVVIVGGGPAGLAAAVNASSEGLKTLVVEREAPGGQAGTTSRIENYLGFPAGLSGGDLARRALIQARRLGTEILSPQEVTAAAREDPYRTLTTADGSRLSCQAMVIACGVTYRQLTLPNADRLVGAGIYYGAATSEAQLHKGAAIGVFGGGNSAGQAAMYLSRFAARVHLIARGATLSERMSQYLVDQIAGAPNIEVHVGTTLVAVDGGERLELATIERAGQRQELAIEALFVTIGQRPHTEWLDGFVQRDPGGFVLTGPALGHDGQSPAGWGIQRDPYLLESSVPGVFVAGDVRHRSVKRIASAVGEGSMAVQFVHQYLATL